MKECLKGRGLVKCYGGREVIHKVNVSLSPGKIYGLIGRNGAGKTTLLSLLSGQNPPTKGEVLIGREKVWENQAMLDRICFSREINPADRSGIGAMKVREYLRTARAYKPSWDQRMADSLLKEFEVDEKARISTLSKGMMSAVTIIVALASKAEYTFLDEPVSGLDVIAREQFYRLLLEEYTSTGRTFVISTHMIEEAANIMEEVLILSDGFLIRQENAQELTERSFRISGRSQDVDAFTEEMEKYHPEELGRGKSVTVILKEGELLPRVPDGMSLDIQNLNLQQLFSALCGRQGGESSETR